VHAVATRTIEPEGLPAREIATHRGHRVRGRVAGVRRIIRCGGRLPRVARDATRRLLGPLGAVRRSIRARKGPHRQALVMRAALDGSGL
jgi:hypothetical protein